MENNYLSNLYEMWVARPLFATGATVLIALSIINARVPFGSQASVKSLMVLIIVVSLLFATLSSWRYFIWLYVAGAVIQGLSFLVPPEAIEQKYFFSYFYLNLGTLRVYLTDFFLLVALIVIWGRMLFPTARNPHIKIFDNWVSRAIGLFVVYGAVIAIISAKVNGKSSLGEARVIWYAIYFFVAVQYFKSDERIIEFLRFFLILTLTRTLICFFTVFISPAYLSYQRPFGSNADAAYCAISFILLVIWGKRLIPDKILCNLALMWLGIFPILITSRSTILCLALALSAYSLLSRQVSMKRLLVFGTSVILVGAVTLYLLISIPQLKDLLGDRFFTLFQNYQDDPTGNWRLLGWLFALESIVKNPLLGIGFGGYAERFVDGQWVTVSLHSAYLDYLYTTGLIGLLPFLSALILSLRSLKRAYVATNDDDKKRYAITLFSIIFFLMAFIGINAEMNYALSGTIMWVFLGMIPFMTGKHVSKGEVPA